MGGARGGHPGHGVRARGRAHGQGRGDANYGARVELIGAGFDECARRRVRLRGTHGAAFIHAFEDAQVIAGQGTIGLELAEQVEGLDTLVVPIGGGGLASGIALALTELRPDVRIVGVQAAAMAPFAGSTAVRLDDRRRHRRQAPGRADVGILRDRLDDFVTVDDEEISEAIVLLLERLKLVAEGAGAASVAALLRGKVEGNGKTVALLSGGNIDPTLLISIARHGLSLAGRSLAFRTRARRPPRRADQAALPDRRGARQHRRRRAPSRGPRSPGRRERGRADADHARPRALRPARGRARGGGLPGQAPALDTRPMIVRQLRHRERAGREVLLRVRRTRWAMRRRRARSARSSASSSATWSAPPRGPRAPTPRTSRGAERLPRSVRADLERFGGTVEKYIGDAVMAVFGAPVAHEDDPERAVRAALAIRDWAREDGSLQVRIAVNTGEALVAVGARAESGEAMVAGDVVNTAARLQSAAPENGVLVGEATHRATERVDRLRGGAAGRGEGQVGAGPAWLAVERARARRCRARRSRTPLVGRDARARASARRLRAARATTARRAGHAHRRPRDRQEPARRRALRRAGARRELIRWRHGRSLPYGEGLAFWALAEIVRAEAGIRETDSRRGGRKLGEAVGALLAETTTPAWVERSLRPLVGLDGERAAHASESFGAWRRFLEALGRPAARRCSSSRTCTGPATTCSTSSTSWSTGSPTCRCSSSRRRGPSCSTGGPGWGGGKRNAHDGVARAARRRRDRRLLAAVLDRHLLPAETQAAAARARRRQPALRRAVRPDARRARRARRRRPPGQRPGDHRRPPRLAAAGGEAAAPRRCRPRPDVLDRRARRSRCGRRAPARPPAQGVHPPRAPELGGGRGRVHVRAPAGARRRLRPDPAPGACRRARARGAVDRDAQRPLGGHLGAAGLPLPRRARPTAGGSGRRVRPRRAGRSPRSSRRRSARSRSPLSRRRSAMPPACSTSFRRTIRAVRGRCSRWRRPSSSTGSPSRSRTASVRSRGSWRSAMRSPQRRPRCSARAGCGTPADATTRTQRPQGRLHSWRTGPRRGSRQPHSWSGAAC